MIKRIFATFCVLLLLTGCSSQDKPTQISFSTWGSASELKVLKRVIADYELKNPSVKIKLQHIPQNYFKKLHLLLASNSEPDVILINNQNLPTYADFLYTFDKSEFKGYFPNSLKCLSYNSELKAVPRDISTLVMYYNKLLITPKPNWTWQDLLVDGKYLKQKGLFTLALEPDLLYVYPFMLAYGENPDGINAENLTEYKSVEFYKSLSEKYGYAPKDYEIGMATPAEFFLGQKSAYYLSGRWMLPKLREAATFPWGVVELPKGKYRSTPCDATGWAISKRSKNIREAKQFVNYLASNKSLLLMSEEGLIIPAKISVANSVISPQPFVNLGFTSKTINYPSKYDKIREGVNKYLRQ